MSKHTITTRRRTTRSCRRHLQPPPQRGELAALIASGARLAWRGISPQGAHPRLALLVTVPHNAPHLRLTPTSVPSLLAQRVQGLSLPREG